MARMTAVVNRIERRSARHCSRPGNMCVPMW
jgi:hypothetical protein